MYEELDTVVNNLWIKLVEAAYIEGYLAAQPGATLDEAQSAYNTSRSKQAIGGLGRAG